MNKISKRRRDTVVVLAVSVTPRDFQRNSQVRATANVILQKEFSPHGSLATAMRLISYCPHNLHLSPEVSEFQERESY